MMRKILLLILLFPFLGKAQKSMRQFYELNSLINKYDYFDESFISTKLRKKLQVKSIKTTYQKNGSKKNYVANFTYNKMGKNTSYVSKNTTIEKEFIHDTLESYVINKTKKDKFESKSTYLDGYLSSRDIFKNGKLSSKYTISYNEDKKVINSQLTRKNKTYEIQNNYNEEKKLIKSVYLINGKVNKQWIYDCKPEGQLVASKTEELSSYCTYKEESADGSYTTFTRTLREGKPYLNKQVFSKDSILISSKTFLNDTILVWEKTKIDNIETFINYKKSGKLIYKQIITYNQDGHVICREYINRKKGPSYSKRVFELNTNGTIQKELAYQKGKLEKTINYEYSFY